MPRGKCTEPSFSTWLLTCIACKVFIAQGINFVFQFSECEDLCWKVGNVIEEKRPKYLQNISIVKHLFVYLEFLVWKFKHFHYYIISIYHVLMLLYYISFLGRDNSHKEVCFYEHKVRQFSIKISILKVTINILSFKCHWPMIEITEWTHTAYKVQYLTVSEYI